MVADIHYDFWTINKASVKNLLTRGSLLVLEMAVDAGATSPVRLSVSFLRLPSSGVQEQP
jgi:hypothetical protein